MHFIINFISAKKLVDGASIIQKSFQIPNILLVQKAVSSFLYKAYNLGFIDYYENSSIRLCSHILEKFETPRIINLTQYLEERDALIKKTKAAPKKKKPITKKIAQPPRRSERINKRKNTPKNSK